MNIVELKQGDRAPSLYATLLDKATRSPVDLTGCSVAFSMRRADTGVTKVDDGPAVIENVLAGEVSYPWQEGDTDTAGEYEGEFTITLADTRKRTFPSKGFIRITISESCQPAAG